MAEDTSKIPVTTDTAAPSALRPRRPLESLRQEIDRLGLEKKRRPYAIAQKATKLQSRIEEIQLSLQCPCPSKYTTKHVKLDQERLEVLNRRRALGNVFPPEEDAEEALRMARYDSFLYGPEVSGAPTVERPS
jgi:hypothetical protein